MASAGIESSSGESLEARIARATLGRSRALLRIGLEIPAWDPWRCLERARDGARPWFAWSSGDGRERLLALGAVAHQPASRADGWSDCDEFCSAVSEQSVHVDLTLETPAPREMPLIVGGMSFSASGAHAPESPWTGWANGALWVPEVVLLQREGRGAACFTHAWASGDDPAKVASWARERARELQHPPRSSWLRKATRAPRRPGSEYEQRVWTERVNSALDAIERGELDKVVLARSARFWAGAGEEFDVTNTLRALQRDQPDCDVFAVGHPDGSVFLGASPEPLLTTRGRSAQTVALAGTVGRGGAPEADARRATQLLQSEKNGREHALVVDAIVEALTPLAERLHPITEAQIRTLTQVHHLETPIAAELAPGVEALSVLSNLHPTPATCGWPRSAASEWIEEHEGLDRGWYAGPVGWLTQSGDSRFCVALRSALIRGDQAYAFSGAGLVQGSTPQEEWRETEMKLLAISQSLMTRAERPQGGDA